VRHHLADARRAGLPFDAAWTPAMEPYANLSPSNAGDDALKTEPAALIATEESWRRSFEGLPPPPGEHALERPPRPESGPATVTIARLPVGKSRPPVKGRSGGACYKL
jgi:hypothetical protein